MDEQKSPIIPKETGAIGIDNNVLDKPPQLIQTPTSSLQNQDEPKGKGKLIVSVLLVVILLVLGAVTYYFLTQVFSVEETSKQLEQVVNQEEQTEEDATVEDETEIQDISYHSANFGPKVNPGTKTQNESEDEKISSNTFTFEEDGYVLTVTDPDDAEFQMEPILFSVRIDDNEITMDAGSAFTFLGTIEDGAFTAYYEGFGTFELEGELIADNHIKGDILVSDALTNLETRELIEETVELEFELKQFENPDNMYIDPRVVPQAWAFLSILKAIQDEDIELFKASYSESMQETFSQDWEGAFEYYSLFVNGYYPDFQLGDFTFSTPLPSYYIIDEMYYKGESMDWSAHVALEDGGWKMNEK